MVAALPEDIVEARKEVAAGTEGTISDFGYYYLAQKIDSLSDKFENKLDIKIDGVRQEINSLRQEIETKIDGLKHELKAEVESVQSSLKTEITGLRQEMNSFRLWSIGTFVAVLIGALSLVISALQ